MTLTFELDNGSANFQFRPTRATTTAFEWFLRRGGYFKPV